MEKRNALIVNPSGVKIELTLNGVVILGSYKRGDGKQGITHPCTPIFGPDRKNIYGLKQHGKMRNEVVNVRNVNKTFIASYTIKDPGYPPNVTVQQMLSINDGIFHFEMLHTNNGDLEAYVNSGEHCYFDAPQGFEGTTVNGQDITDLIKINSDGTAIDLKDKNRIRIPGKPEYIMEQTGFKKAVVWVGKNPETGEIDTSYVCIEPVEDDPFGDFFGSSESLLAVGDSRRSMFRLSINMV